MKTYRACFARDPQNIAGRFVRDFEATDLATASNSAQAWAYPDYVVAYVVCLSHCDDPESPARYVIGTGQGTGIIV